MQATAHGEVLPRLTTRVAVVTEVGFLALGALIFVIIWVAGPWLWWLSAPVILVLGYGAAVLLTSTTWIDAQAGTLTRRGWRLRPATLLLSQATELQLRGSGGGGARLTVRAGSTSALVELASVSLFANRSLRAPALTLLADVLDAHVPAQVRADVPRRLRAQARHIASGGSVETSPLSAPAGA
jgi:hypothetical protein